MIFGVNLVGLRKPPRFVCVLALSIPASVLLFISLAGGGPCMLPLQPVPRPKEPECSESSPAPASRDVWEVALL
ncbi:hypothetical protein DFH07DRAFT_836830 [Mycena maculata]|uniref:Uncharacterized protein n=1 Tax=Mycena maculata TaxID=230809 RepID=A0AAD7IGY3_9AGAR|nr:hypothetical protein DFH07DRAFT_836830 [Mycena maculata]